MNVILLLQLTGQKGRKGKFCHHNSVLLGKCYVGVQKKQIAKAAWKCEIIRPHLYEEIVKETDKECVYMCVKDTKKAKNWKKAAAYERQTKKALQTSHLMSYSKS